MERGKHCHLSRKRKRLERGKRKVPPQAAKRGAEAEKGSYRERKCPLEDYRHKRIGELEKRRRLAQNQGKWWSSILRQEIGS